LDLVPLHADRPARRHSVGATRQMRDVYSPQQSTPTSNHPRPRASAGPVSRRMGVCRAHRRVHLASPGSTHAPQILTSWTPHFVSDSDTVSSVRWVLTVLLKGSTLCAFQVVCWWSQLLWVFGDATDIQIGPSLAWEGTIIAPNADVMLQAGMQLRGSVVADSIGGNGTLRNYPLVSDVRLP